MKTVMTKAANNAGPPWPDTGAVAGAETVMSNTTAHVGTTGCTHASSTNLRQQRGCYS
jgi:hypothetical protein